MSEVVRFISKSDLDRARLIQEARAIYENIFPQANRISEAPIQSDDGVRWKGPITPDQSSAAPPGTTGHGYSVRPNWRVPMNWGWLVRRAAIGIGATFVVGAMVYLAARLVALAF
jgi:hypothetical protein